MLAAKEWEVQFTRILPVLNGADSVRARTAAQNFANQYSNDSYLDVSELMAAARDLPAIGARAIGPGMTSPPNPNSRDENFDVAIAKFIDAARTAIFERAAFEEAMAANRDLTRAQCRDIVHRFLGTRKEHVFGDAIVGATSLSGEQVHDALEELHEEWLLADDSIKSETLGGTSWRVRLNATGRNLLDGTKPMRPEQATGPVVNHFNISTAPTHAPHMPEDVRQSFLAEMPRMRGDFKKKLAEFKSTIFHVSNYPAVLPQGMLDLAEGELHRRLDIACAKVEGLLESGWVPTALFGRREALMECFAGAEMHNDPFSDIYAVADNAYSHMPHPEPQDKPSLRQRLAQTQTWASDAAIKRVETYVVKHRPTINVNNNAPVGAQQFGDNNSAFVNQPVTADNRSIRLAISEIEERIDEFPATEQDEVREHLETAKAELTSDNPRNSKIGAAFKAIERAAREYSLDAIGKVTEGVVSGLGRGGT